MPRAPTAKAQRIEKLLGYTVKIRKLEAYANLALYCGIAITLASVADLSKTQISSAAWDRCIGGNALYVGLGMVVIGNIISVVLQRLLNHLRTKINHPDSTNKFFSSNRPFLWPALTISGILSSIAGIILMEERIWHAGEYIFLTGIALRILGVIISFYTTNKEEVGIVDETLKGKPESFARVVNANNKIPQCRSLALLGLFTGCAGALMMTKNYLSSSDSYVFPTLSSPAMILFLTGVVITLLSMPMLNYYMSLREENTTGTSFHDKGKSVWNTSLCGQY